LGSNPLLDKLNHIPHFSILATDFVNVKTHSSHFSTSKAG